MDFLHQPGTRVVQGGSERLLEPNARNRWFINVLSISDVYLHWGEVATVAGAIRAARRAESSE